MMSENVLPSITYTNFNFFKIDVEQLYWFSSYIGKLKTPIGIFEYLETRLYIDVNTAIIAINCIHYIHFPRVLWL